MPSETFEEIVWDPKPMLQPGMDYHNGITYFTIPILRRVALPPKKKGDQPKLIERFETFAITSEREGIWYNNDALAPHGLQPNPKVHQETETRWSYPSARAYLDGTVSAPSTEELFEELRSIYVKYVEFADETYFDIMSLYVLYSYVFRLFESTGYVHFNGTAASGKSRNLSILNALAFNTIWASSMSAASLYRKLAGSPGTTCIDESEGFDGERGEDLRRILNAGYRNGATVFRSEKQDEKWVSVYYEVFGPKALASINTMEPVIQSRCLVVAMRPAIRELPDFLAHDKRWPILRDKMYLWAMEHTDTLASLVLAWQEEGATSKKVRLAPRLIGRQWETTAQYVVLADYVGGEEFASRIITFANEYFARQQEAMDATDRLRTTLRCLPRVLSLKQSYPGNLYSVKDIHEVIASFMESDATEYFKTKHVTKNLEVLGFKKKVRATGGLQIELEEEKVRKELNQRRVAPFDEDLPWLAGETSYQGPTSLWKTVPEGRPKPTDAAWWELDGEDEQQH